MTTPTTVDLKLELPPLAKELLAYPAPEVIDPDDLPPACIQAYNIVTAFAEVLTECLDDGTFADSAEARHVIDVCRQRANEIFHIGSVLAEV